jgi:Spy/CpxP family protein refolding chaperone
VNPLEEARLKTIRSLIVAAALLVAPAFAQHPSPYAGQQDRDIKALSPDEVRDYLDGKGMGLARAAELNGYPGPMHVLDLAGPLALSAEQRASTQALFESMRSRAIEAGRALVEAERELDALFRQRTINEAQLAQALARIGERQAQVRRVHLEAHLAQTALLTPAQVQRYAELRGYAQDAAHGNAHQHDKRH